MPSCGMPLRSRLTSATSSRLVSPPSPLEVLTTIRTSTAARTRNAAPAAICSNRWRRSGSALTRHRRLGPRVADQARRAEQEEDRHQDGAGDAPLADRFDLEELDPGQVDAEAETAEGDGEAAQTRRVAGKEGACQQQRVADDPEDGDVDAEKVRVGAIGDGFAAGPAGGAGGRPAAAVGDRDVGGDPDSQRRDEGDAAAQGPLARKVHRAEDMAFP